MRSSSNGTVFTARASGAAGNEYNIAGSLTLTIDALAAVLNASVVAVVATYANSGDAMLTVTHATAGAPDPRRSFCILAQPVT